MSRRRRSRNSPKAKIPHVAGTCGTVFFLVMTTGLLFSGCAQEGVHEAVSIMSKQDLSYEAYEVDSLPTWFTEEFFDDSYSEKIFANESETVFGLISPNDPETVFQEICASMLEHDWSRIESGIEHCASFVRERGSPAWALISCSQIGNETSIVICTEGRSP